MLLAKLRLCEQLFSNSLSKERLKHTRPVFLTVTTLLCFCKQNISQRVSISIITCKRGVDFLFCWACWQLPLWNPSPVVLSRAYTQHGTAFFQTF